MRQGLKLPLIRARDSFFCHIGFKTNIQFRLSNAFCLFKLIDWQQNVNHSISCLEPKPVSASKTIAYIMFPMQMFSQVLENPSQRNSLNTLASVGMSKHHFVIKPPKCCHSYFAASVGPISIVNITYHLTISE